MLALLRGMPAVARWGIALTLAGLAIDIAVHTTADSAFPTGGAAAAGHLVTLAGMLVAMGSVIHLGLRGWRGAEGRRR